MRRDEAARRGGLPDAVSFDFYERTTRRLPGAARLAGADVVTHNPDPDRPGCGFLPARRGRDGDPYSCERDFRGEAPRQPEDRCSAGLSSLRSLDCCSPAGGFRESAGVLQPACARCWIVAVLHDSLGHTGPAGVIPGNEWHPGRGLYLLSRDRDRVLTALLAAQRVNRRLLQRNPSASQKRRIHVLQYDYAFRSRLRPDCACESLRADDCGL